MDSARNFARVTASTGYAAGDTSIVLTTGHGAKLPDPATDGAFNLVWWDSTIYSTPSDDPNVEVVRCTARSTDTLTVSRAQEGTSDSAKNTGGSSYSLSLCATKKVVDDARLLSMTSVALTDGATIDWDMSKGTFATVTLGGNRMLNNPTNIPTAMPSRLIVTQDATGGRTLAFGSAYKFQTYPTLYSVGGSYTIFDFHPDGTSMFCLSKVTSPGCGYFAGGYSPISYENTNDRLDFSSDTTTMATKGALSVARYSLAASNSTTYGYFAGGNSGAVVTTNDRLDFSSDATTMTTKGSLSQARSYLAAANSTTYGYFAGGYSNNYANTNNRLDFASDATTMVTKGALSVARQGLAGANSTTYGYFAGGDSGARVTTNDRLDFASDATTMVTKGALSQARSYLAAANSTTYGYFAGGSTGARVTTNDRLDFASDATTMVTKGALSQARNGLAACQSGGIL